MNVPKKLDEIIVQLNVDNKHRLLVKEAASDVLQSIEEAMFIGYPKVIYEAARHLLGRGKLLRGILVMLVNESYGFTKKDKALKIATAIELLHTASLIHDDILDGVKIRRGVEAVHKRYGLNIAIISTDLLISIAYNLCSGLGEKVIKIVSDAGRRMSEAEVLEYIIDDPDLDDYFKIIDGKSSALIGAACMSGAIVSNANEKEVQSFKKYGELIGRVLQIRDDLLDYVSNEIETGKSNPLLYGLKRINIVDVLMNKKEISLDEAISDSNKLGKTLADQALKEISFMKLDKRNIFEEFFKFILERKF